ncbi:serine/threonine-protein kinase [Goodfellowiella coeruleoviolacea]|uniref:serine/threonine-protein kinase n=1 Tax=Goodfellowiella coeruleoviolacea TaxID=334858 RepID=UPI0020A5F360|nr:serine/threonine-protein kinase [Goodfellowiella coeruleoviolacea]
MEDLPVRRSRSVGHGRYRLGQRLGRGGAAEVYWARDTRLDRPVAVKLFRLAGDMASRARFEREARLLASLSHPSLVTVLDAGEQDDQAFLVMQLVEAGTLRQRLDDGPLSPRGTALLGTQVAAALAYVHARGIIHRDVKPSNILLDADGSAHLADFGLSRVLGSTHLTESGQLVGTPGYLAPEQVIGGEVAPAADIYALGLVLLECLRGEPEYTGTHVEIAVARLHREPHVPASLPPALAGLLRSMTASEPKARPSAQQCVRRLRELAADLPRSTPISGGAVDTVPVHRQAQHLADEPDGPAGPVRGDQGRAGRRWALSGVVASLAAATVVAVSLLGPETKPPQSTPSQPQGSSLPTSEPGQPDGSTPVDTPVEQNATELAEQPADQNAAPAPEAPPRTQPGQPNETVTVYQTPDAAPGTGSADDIDSTADSGTEESEADNGNNGNGGNNGGESSGDNQGSGENESKHKSRNKGRG